MTSLKKDERWAWFGVTSDFLEEKSSWLKECRTLHGSAHRFFEVAGALVNFARYDYAFASVAFFQGVLGLEKALRLHFNDDDESLRALLKKSVDAGAITGTTLGNCPEFSERFSKQVTTIVGKHPPSRLECLVELLPELRNQYFHGTYLLAPDYLYLTLQVRRMADALTTKS